MASDPQPEEERIDVQDRSNKHLVDEEAIEKLSSGLLAMYQPDLERVRHHLLELTKKQESVIKKLETENKNFSEQQQTKQLHEMLATIRLYHGKLSGIKKEMTSIHDRTTKLKKRALRIQQEKQREALTRTQQREEQLQHEQQLIAQPGTSMTTASSSGDLQS